MMVSMMPTAWSQGVDLGVFTHEEGSQVTISTDGIKADNPATVMSIFLDSCAVNGNYKILCDPQIEQTQLQNAVEVFNKYAGSYFLAFPDDDAEKQELYAQLKGTSISLPENHYLFKAIKLDRNDRSYPIKDFGAFGVVSHDTTNNTYWIAEFGIGNQ